MKLANDNTNEELVILHIPSYSALMMKETKQETKNHLNIQLSNFSKDSNSSKIRMLHKRRVEPQEKNKNKK